MSLLRSLSAAPPRLAKHMTVPWVITCRKVYRVYTSKKTQKKTANVQTYRSRQKWNGTLWRKKKTVKFSRRNLPRKLILRRRLFTIPVFVDLQDYELCDWPTFSADCLVKPLGISVRSRRKTIFEKVYGYGFLSKVRVFRRKHHNTIFNFLTI